MLAQIGAEHLQTCPSTLWTPAGERVTQPVYRAVNILGAIWAADLERSEYTEVSGTGDVAMGFRQLVIGEGKADGALLFRRAEALASIVVHARAKERIQAAGLGLFFPSERWARRTGHSTWPRTVSAGPGRQE